MPPAHVFLDDSSSLNTQCKCQLDLLFMVMIMLLDEYLGVSRVMTMYAHLSAGKGPSGEQAGHAFLQL